MEPMRLTAALALVVVPLTACGEEEAELGGLSAEENRQLDEAAALLEATPDMMIDPEELAAAREEERTSAAAEAAGEMNAAGE